MEHLLSEALKTGENVQLGEALSAGLMVTCVGLAIVFSVLVVLMIVLMLFKVIFYKEDPKKKTEAIKPQEEKPQAQPQAVQNNNNDDELIAVIAAAIAASLNTSTSKFKIRSYRRIENNKPAWNRAGISDTMNSRI